MELRIAKDRPFLRIASFACIALIGAGLLALSALVKIPFFPIPFTLQTLALFIIALTQSPSQAFASTLCYLLCGTIGLPVFGGQVSSFWVMGASAGYLIAFPIAAFIASWAVQRKSPYLAVFAGQVAIYTVGFLWLTFFVGPRIALINGVVFFIPSAILKNLIAVGIATRWRAWRASVS